MKSRNTTTLFAGLLSLIVVTSCSSTQTGATSYSDNTELHIIGVYEGNDYESDAHDHCLETCEASAQDFEEEDACHESTCKRPAWPSKHASKLPVTISRPGQTVTLILGSYGPLTWDLTVEDSTKVGGIILIGSGAKNGSVTINGKPRTNLSRHNYIRVPTEMAGKSFRKLIDVEIGRFGFGKISSFQGERTAPDTGFVIDGPIRNPEFSSDYLDKFLQAPTTAMEIEAVMNGKIGLFKLDGTFIESKQPIQTPKSPISSDGRTRYIYDTRKWVIQVIDTKTNLTTHSIPAAGEPRYESFESLVLDEKRNRLLLNFDNRDGNVEIHSIDLDTHKIELITTIEDLRLATLLYDAAQDSFLTLNKELRGGISIGRLTPNGSHATIREFDWHEFMGISDVCDDGDAPSPVVDILGVEGDTIAIATDGVCDFTDHPMPGPLKRVYELDLTTGDIRLTYYD